MGREKRKVSPKLMASIKTFSHPPSESEVLMKLKVRWGQGPRERGLLSLSWKPARKGIGAAYGGTRGGCGIEGGQIIPRDIIAFAEGLKNSSRSDVQVPAAFISCACSMFTIMFKYRTWKQTFGPIFIPPCIIPPLSPSPLPTPTWEAEKRPTAEIDPLPQVCSCLHGTPPEAMVESAQLVEESTPATPATFVDTVTATAAVPID